MCNGNLCDENNGGCVDQIIDPTFTAYNYNFRINLVTHFKLYCNNK
jgi:hypothetical protein